MNRHLWTTKNDLSVDLFEGWKVFFYEDHVKPSEVSDASLVYFRDPFNSPEYTPDTEFINEIISMYHNATSLDHIRSFRDMLELEDKYLQFKRYGELMPKTHLATEIDFVEGRHIMKPRISQRAKNIFFSLPDNITIDDSLIIQDIMHIKEELRVYVVFGKIINLASIKSSKSTGKVKVIGSRELAPAELDFVTAVHSKDQLDFSGIDLAVLDDGSLKIIEVNRSPQFKTFYTKNGVNVAQKLVESVDFLA